MGTPLAVTIRSLRAGIPRPLIALLYSVAEQLSSLELDLSDADFRFLGQDPMALPNLKRLAMTDDGHTPPHGYHPLSIIRNAAALLQLRIERWPTNGTFDIYPALTTIELGRISYQNPSDLLRTYPRLLHLRAHITDAYERRGPAPPTPYLRSLALGRLDVSPFTLPLLRRLETDVSYYYNCNDPTILPFLTRSSCALEHLTVQFHHDGRSGFIPCMKAVPSLTSLTVKVRNRLHTFIRVVKADPSVLPILRTLHIAAEYKDFDYLACVQLLQVQRSRTPVRLESLRLTLEDGDVKQGFNSAHWEHGKIEFEKLIAQGLKVTVTFKSPQTTHVWPEKNTDLCENFLLDNTL
ncbi:hypothetical protein DFH06DRAFT_391251 [Mycena polygramma]|nr:hypothetical protein DFH06DRAFT_391251 [Mycena polygramma]